MSAYMVFPGTIIIVTLFIMLFGCSSRGFSTSISPPPDPGTTPYDEVLADVQRKLNRMGANLEVDGQTGPKTQRAIKNFQRSVGQINSGEINQELIEALNQQASIQNQTAAIEAANRDTGQPTHWAFAATPNRLVHGVATGSSELWATEMAKRACRAAREKDPEMSSRFPCVYARKFAKTEPACISFLWTSGSSPKFYGIATGADKALRMKESMQKAIDSCRQPSFCQSFSLTTPANAYTYCTEDFFP